jgi:hypothetical protein
MTLFAVCACVDAAAAKTSIEANKRGCTGSRKPYGCALLCSSET